ncbi:MAG: PilT/PilU family type 4a pilus ATPase [Kofleriaceae bacterium]
MSAQLEQILAYLDKDGVSEIVVAVGRPIAMRQKGAYVNLTQRPLTLAMLWAFVEGSEIATLVPHGDGSTDPTDLDVGRRRLRVRTGRRGNEIVVRIEKGAARMRAASRPPPVKVGAATADFDLPVELDVPELPMDALTLDEPGLPRRGSAAEGQRGVVDESKLAVPASKVIGSSVSIGMKRPPPPEQHGGLELDLDDEDLELDAPKPVKPFTGGGTAIPTAVIPVIRETGAIPVIHAQTAGTFAQYVAAARAAKASDLHIAGNRVVSVRTNGELAPISADARPLTAEQAETILLPLLSAADRERLQSAGYVDLAIDAPGGGRLRANISRHQVGLKGTFRLAFDRPRTLEELGLPKDLAKVVAHHQGFVVIAGPSGAGKTTTLAALVDATRPHHILTVEDPIEIEHPRKMALVSQREAGRHTKSFATALKASLREDPDVIVIGELRDRESVEIALTAAETGHLVLATMSTPSAAKTLDRLIDMFPPAEHSQVRASIAGALRAIVAQRLLPAIGGGVIPAIELVTGVLPLAVLIRDDKLFQLPNLMQRGRAFGMIRFDESLADLVRAGKISEETALLAADSRAGLATQLKGPAAPTPAAPPGQGLKGRLGGLFGKKEGDT